MPTPQAMRSRQQLVTTEPSCSVSVSIDTVDMAGLGATVAVAAAVNKRYFYTCPRLSTSMDLFGRDEPADGIALFVDGPNMLRDEFDVDLDDIREATAEKNRLATARLYVDEHATPGLIQAAEARGFEVIVTSGDVDVKLSVDATRFATEGRAETLAIASRDTDFKPVLEVANSYGLATLAIAPGSHGRSDALRNAATESLTLAEFEGSETGDETTDNDT